MNLSEQIDIRINDSHANLKKSDVRNLIKQTAELASTCVDCMHADLLNDG